MTLPRPTDRYRADVQADHNRIVEEADRQNLKRNADIELVIARLILHSPNGSRWNITITNAGVLTPVLLP